MLLINRRGAIEASLPKSAVTALTLSRDSTCPPLLEAPRSISMGSAVRSTSFMYPASQLSARARPREPVRLPTLVIGAGPVGLAAAVHLLNDGVDFLIFEAGNTIGAAVETWGHVQMFSPWQFNIDRSAGALLKASGWQEPSLEQCPTGREFLDAYLMPLSRIADIAKRLYLNTKVLSVTRAKLSGTESIEQSTAPFEVTSTTSTGRTQRIRVAAVIDASGTWMRANPLGADYAAAPGEEAAAGAIRYGMPDILGSDRGRYAGKRILVVGSGYSAAGNLLNCGALREVDQRTKIYWALRSSALPPLLSLPTSQLPERSRLADRLKAMISAGRCEVLAPFVLEEVTDSAGGAVTIRGRGLSGSTTIVVDQIIAATGATPDYTIFDGLRMDIDPVIQCPAGLAGLVDPAIHTCATVSRHGAYELQQPESDLFVVGMKSYGRAPTFLLATGYEQVRSVAAWIAGRPQDVQSAEGGLSRL